MSRKTVIMTRKVAQAARRGKKVDVLLPTGIAKSNGRMTRITRILSDDEQTSTTKRQRGIASGAICTQPMSTTKQERFRARFR